MGVAQAVNRMLHRRTPVVEAPEPLPPLSLAIRWENHNVSAFDANGQRVCSGFWEHNRERVIAALTPATILQREELGMLTQMRDVEEWAQFKLGEMIIHWLTSGGRDPAYKTH